VCAVSAVSRRLATEGVIPVLLIIGLFGVTGACRVELPGYLELPFDELDDEKYCSVS